MQITVEDVCELCKRNSAESIKVIWNALDRKYRGKGITREQVEEAILEAVLAELIVLEDNNMIRLSSNK